MHLSTSAVALFLFASCATTPSASSSVVVYHGIRSRAFRASQSEARAAILRTFEGRDYAVLEDGAGGGPVVARSPATTRFFAMLGEQSKWYEVTATLTPDPGDRVRVDLDAVLVSGPAGGGSVTRRPARDDWLFEGLFERIHSELFGPG